MSKISERFKHTKITHGYCLICGEHGRLSIDHVPPQGAITVTQIEQRHISEMTGAKSSTIKGVRSPNGSKFKTICHHCNSQILGVNDIEVARFNKLLTEKVITHFHTVQNPYNFVSLDIDAIKYARAMIGHILSATSVVECRKEQNSSPFFDPLKEFVLGNDDAISETHDIYYWFYPHNRHLSAKYVHFSNNGHSTGLSLLSFFPIAFLVTVKDKGIYPAHAKKLDLSSNRFILDLSSFNVAYADFPFVELKGAQMYLLTEYQTIISYPIKKSI
ncbi:metal-binding protein [Vibrio cyclitrophicus]|uniref:metal-binding protein n=1 Tax=Vibrio cyclitrophicus TaxID=47951 RepID=UPI00206F16CB|nr:metal-binding protein [Vibrio cyclitrophicus]UPR24965.1 metal-binding protein [Vibrio cyclitrophicus]